MPALDAIELPARADWQGVERLCRDLWRELWGDPNTQMHGARGQPQHGVDVFGRPGDGGDWAGVQCIWVLGSPHSSRHRSRHSRSKSCQSAGGGSSMASRAGMGIPQAVTRQVYAPAGAPGRPAGAQKPLPGGSFFSLRVHRPPGRYWKKRSGMIKKSDYPYTIPMIVRSLTKSTPAEHKRHARISG